MKRLIIALLIITITLAARFVYVQLLVQHSFGPLSILLISILGCLCLLLSITLLYSTRGRKTIAKMWLSIISLLDSCDLPCRDPGATLGPRCILSQGQGGV